MVLINGFYYSTYPGRIVYLNYWGFMTLTCYIYLFNNAKDRL